MAKEREPKIQIQLTRAQALQVAASTGLILDTLELDLTEGVEGAAVPAQIPVQLTAGALTPERLEARFAPGRVVN